jgi:hypothetical protein
MKKCPHCGSKNLEVDESAGHDFQIIYCLDCDAVFETKVKGARKSGGARRDRDYDDVDDAQWDDFADEAEDEDTDYDDEDEDR